MLLFAGIFLPNSVTAQPQTFFYRAWAQTGGSYTPSPTKPTVTKVNASGETFVARSVLNASTTYSMNLSKYASSGTLSWAATFDVNTGGDVYVGAMAFDPAGNILVTGSAYNGTTNNYDLFVVKYGPTGTQLWNRLHNGPANAYDFGAAVACDAANGDVYVTGGAFQTALNPNVVTIRYNPSGTVQWAQTWDNVSLVDAGGNIAFNTANTVTITGFTQVSLSTWEYVALSYVRSTGQLQSANVTNLGGTSIDRASAVAFDNAGNTYIAGALGAAGQGLNIKTVKFDPSLNILWAADWNGAANLDDAANALVVDASGNVYVAGYSTTAAGRDAVLLQYTSGGSASTAQNYDSGGDDAFQSVALTSDGGLFAAGYASPKGNKDCLAVFYLNGSLRWQETCNGYANGDDEIKQLSPDGSGGFFANGPSAQQGGGTANQTIRYARHALLLPQNEEVNAPFIENRGQLLGTDNRPATDVRYYTRSNYPNVYILDDRASFAFAHIDTLASTLDTMTRLDLTFGSHGSGGATVAAGLERQEDFHNYYLGHIPEGRERVPLENKVLHPNIYAYIDALYGLGQDGFFMRLICKPGSNPANIQLRFTGQTAISIQTDGSLRVETVLEDLVLAKPTAIFSDANGVESAPTWAPAFVLNTDGSVGLSLGSVPSGSSLIVGTGRGRNYGGGDDCDYWSTYYGETSFEINLGSEVDENGFMYFTGKTYSALFPTTDGAVQEDLEGISDAFVSCFMQPDIRKWITFYGGTESQNQSHNHQIEAGYAIKWRKTDNTVYVVGRTSADDFPLKQSSGYFNADFENDEGTRGFIIKFDANEGGLLWATFFGDSKKKYDGAIALLIRQNGNVAVGGYCNEYFTEESSFPFFPNSTPSLSPHIQTWGGMYVAEFDGDNNQQVWATKLGNDLNGAYGAGGVMNTVNDIDEDKDGNLFVLGTMFEDALPNEPTGNDFVPIGTNSMPFSTLQFGHGCEACFFSFDLSKKILWSTYLGGWNNEYANSIICDKHGSIVVTGTTLSDDFPATAVGDAGDPLLNDLSLGGDADIFMAKFVKIETEVYALTWARYIGGPGYDRQSTVYVTSDVIQFSGSGNAAAEGGGGDILLTGEAMNDFSPIIGINGCIFYYPEINRGMIDFGADAIIMVVGSNQKVNFSTYWGGDILGVLSFDEGTTISHGISYNNKPFLIVGGRTNSQASSITIPVCHESPIPLPYYNSDFLGGPLDAFISKIYYGECLTSGTEEPLGKVSEISASPNPAAESVTIRIAIENEILSLSIYDASGKDFSSLVAISRNADGSAGLGVDRLPSGLYCARIRTNMGQLVSRFVKI